MLPRAACLSPRCVNTHGEAEVPRGGRYEGAAVTGNQLARSERRWKPKVLEFCHLVVAYELGIPGISDCLVNQNA